MLRDYQIKLNAEIEQSWRNGNRNVLGVLPTGGGKTVCMSALAAKLHAPQIAIAHRQELVGQISLALARAKLYHRIIAPDAVKSFIIAEHYEELGTHFYQTNAPIAVAGVDTLIRRTGEFERFLKQCQLWQTDEGHHLTGDGIVHPMNKWSRAVSFMPNARGVAWTATPIRSDRRSLKRGAGGLYDDMVIGPSMRELIDRGYLCEYRIFAPQSDINLASVKITPSGEYNANELHMATERSQIVGDVVKTYLKYAMGKRGITFAVDASLGQQHTDAFNATGIPAALLTDKTPQGERRNSIRRFKRGELLMLVNVDIIGEGFDVPAIECAIFARATASYGLFVQQFGRALRILSGKQFGIIIDHVGNIVRHGLPDAPQYWTLDTPIREPRSDELPTRQCPNPDCFRVFQGYGMTCPHCGFRPKAQDRSAPELVEGDLIEFGPELLKRLRADAARLVSERQAVPVRLGAGIAAKVSAAQAVRAEAQKQLRDAMAYWAGVQRVGGLDESASYRKFFHVFGVDALTAQTLGTEEATKLYERVHHAVWNDWKAA